MHKCAASSQDSNTVVSRGHEKVKMAETLRLLSVLNPFNLLKSAICPQLLLILFCRVLLTLQCMCLFDCVAFAVHALLNRLHCITLHCVLSICSWHGSAFYTSALAAATTGGVILWGMCVHSNL